MKTRLAFYVPRSNHLRIMAPVIRHLTKTHSDTYELLICYPTWPIAKRFLQVTEEMLHETCGARATLCALRQPMDLLSTLRHHQAKAFINVSPSVNEINAKALAVIRTQSRQDGVKWIALPYVNYQDVLCAADPEAVSRDWDVVCTLGAHSMEYVSSRMQSSDADVRQAMLDRLVPIGYPELDGLATIDRATVLKKYGLPTAKPIIFLSTAPSYYRAYGGQGAVVGYEMRFRGWDAVPPHRWLNRLYTLHHAQMISYRQYLGALREMADRNGAIIVAKTRTKHRDPRFLQSYCDYLFDDVTFYPFTTLELASVSGLYFGFFSMAIVEAVAAGAYAITAKFAPIDEIAPPGASETATYLTACDTLGNTAGVSEVIDGMTPQGVARLTEIRHAPLSDFQVDAQQRHQLLNRFFSHHGHSAAAFTRVLQKRVCS